MSITHLPQIAALGSTHYKVSEEDLAGGYQQACDVQLDEKGRVEEMAHVLSGTTLTDAAINNAKELLNQSYRK